ncbi:MAG: 2-hydroxyacyl-CoA dehydratase family protein [Eubacteriales bacterium]|nr:2-hydroxyacyl-CoA dehydratase family protein [Eubacteriales bacterium]
MAKKNIDYKQLAKDFWYGKPHTAEEGGRRLGELQMDKTGLYRHREWRGFKDTMYYMYNVWGYNYVHMVTDIMKYGNLVDFMKGTWRYRWMGQTYLPVIHWFDRGLAGLRGEALRASAWHYRAMVSAALQQICNFFIADTRLHNGEQNEDYKHTFLAKETTWGGMFYPWADAGFKYIPIEMIPYFVTCHVNSHTVLNYIDAVQSIGLPGDPCPMCQAEAGLYVLDDVPDSSPFVITCNEACDGSVATAIVQDWFIDKPLFALPLPMQFDDPLVRENCMKEIEECWKFIEDQTGVPFNWESMQKRLEMQNKLQRDEHEKWEVAANTDFYPINGVAQALFRIFSTQYGIQGDFWDEASEKVKKIMYKCVEKKINPFPQTRHRVIAWSCAPLYYSNWCTWAYNCWGLNVIINMDSLMFDMEVRNDTYEHMLEDVATYHMWAPMRRMAVGGMHHIFELWDYMEKFNCDMVAMYDQLQCKGMQGVHGLFEDEFRKRDVKAFWMPHALPDSRTVSRAEIRRMINDYMTTVMHEEPLDPSLLDFDDSMTW